jgi:hypothetical protein
MTPEQWQAYFKVISRGHKVALRKALNTLDADPMFKQVYQTQFSDIEALIELPPAKPRVQSQSHKRH